MSPRYMENASAEVRPIESHKRNPLYTSKNPLSAINGLYVAREGFSGHPIGEVAERKRLVKGGRA